VIGRRSIYNSVAWSLPVGAAALVVIHWPHPWVMAFVLVAANTLGYAEARWNP
jgi:hypothetical protein